MKRLFVAAGMALVIHGAFLSIKAPWLHKISRDFPSNGVVMITLAYQEPQKSVMDSPVRKPEPPPEKPAHVAEKIIPRPIPKPESRKQAPRPLKTVKTSPKVLRKALSRVRSAEVPSEIRPETSLKPSVPPAVERSSASLQEDVPKDIFQGSRLEAITQKTGVLSRPVLREATPNYRKNPLPRYPTLARRRGYEGTTVLEVLVNRKGNVGNLRVCESSGYGMLDRAAMEAVEDWLFEPGMRGDETVDMWVKVPIRFQLK